MASSSVHVFTRDYFQNNCINLQHYLCVKLFGYHVQSSIPPSGLKTELRIADVGTGAWIWLTDLDTLPKSVCLDALDLSFHATPLLETLPSNISLRYWDIKTDIPEHLLGIYDVVNIRHFAITTQEPELEAVTYKLLRLLKPGGYLQWTDIDVNSLRVGKIQPEIQSNAQIKPTEPFKGSDVRLRPGWVPRLLAEFTKVGFIDVTADIKLEVDVTADIKVAPPYLARVLLHEREMPATELLTRNKPAPEDVGLKQTLEQTAKETRDGLYLTFTRYTVIGRKE